jgi:uncharacterized protein
MSFRFLAFFSVATTLVLLAHAYVGSRWIGPSGLTGGARQAAWAGVLAWALLVPAAMGSRFALRGIFSDVVAWVGYVAMGVFSFAFVLTLLRDVGVFAATKASLFDPARRDVMLRFTNGMVMMATLTLSAWGVLQARKRAAIVDVVVPIKDLPAELEGFTIAQITDVHVGPTIKRGFIDGIVDGVNSIGADIVAVTGDVVDGDVDVLREHTAPFARLQSKLGVFYVTGNHEYYSGAPAWVAEFARLGMKPLMNEHVVVEKDGRRVLVGGVTDYNAAQIEPTHATDAHKAIAGAPTVDVKVLLAHQPRSATAAADAGFDLQLSGHTHGGQLFPWMFFVRLQQPFTAGLDRLRDMWVYTSRGTGYWGPPMRVGAPAEITRIRLTRAA